MDGYGKVQGESRLRIPSSAHPFGIKAAWTGEESGQPGL